MGRQRRPWSAVTDPPDGVTCLPVQQSGPPERRPDGARVPPARLERAGCARGPYGARSGQAGAGTTATVRASACAGTEAHGAAELV